MTLISCNDCGGKISDRARYCPHCGAPVTYINERRLVEVCRDCEQKISDRAKYCPHCGAPTMSPIRSLIIEICIGISLIGFSISYVLLISLHD